MNRVGRLGSIGRLVALAAILAACGSAGPAGQSTPAASPSLSSVQPQASAPAATREPFPLPSGLPTAAPDFEPPTADSTAPVAAIGEDGLLDKDAALRLFHTTIAELPGVSGEKVVAAGRSGSLAIRSVTAHWEELTPEQRQAIEAALTLPSDAVVVEIPPVSEPDGTFGQFAAVNGPVQDHPYTAELLAAMRAAGRTIRQMIASRMDGDIPGKVDVTIASCEPYLGCALSLWQSPTGPSLTGSGAYAGCTVQITRQALSGGAPWIVSTIAHEIFHCFQAHGYGSRERAARAPAWVIEGGAEWVQNDITGDLSPTDFLMAPWFQSPGISLMKRAYDAAGFWARLDETGTSPYDVFPFVFLTGDGPSAYRASGAESNQHFMNSWASSITLKEEFGGDWEMHAPGMPGLAAPAETWEVANDSSVEIHALPYTARVFSLDVSADLLLISGTGHARISDGQIDTFLFPARFCTKEGGCQQEPQPPQCPGDQPPPEQLPPAPLQGESWFVLTGGATGSTFTIVGERLEDEESEPCPTPKPTEDEFCKRWRALLDWMGQQAGSDFELSQPWAAEISTRSQDMRPYAPPHLVDGVDVYIRVYGTYATAPEPMNVPIVGPEAAGIGIAFMANNAYCGIVL